MIGALYRHLRKTVYRRLAGEIGSSSRYFDRVWYVVAGEDDLLGELVPAREMTPLDDVGGFAPTSGPDGRDLLVLNGVLNSSLDIQGMLLEARGRMRRGDRLAAVLYNPYFRTAYAIADALRLRSAPAASTFITHVDLDNLARLAGFQVVRVRPVSPFPFRLLGLGTIIDGILRATPFLREFSPVQVATLRPIARHEERPSLSIVVPARNESGNIQAALDRLPEFPGAEVEVIFVEGHSTDDTWEEVQRVVGSHRGDVTVKALQQIGKGKVDAVRLGFSEATGDLLTILDADLTMPPELLPRFYEAYCRGHGDFINGSRLVYPMEDEAMRSLNRAGNVFFSKALSSILETRLGDTLCGTKLIARRDYERVTAWREDFGDFDPFGDFELLFPAAVLGLGVVDVPIRYLERTYGETNISRWRGGYQLGRMALVGLIRIRMGLRPPRYADEASA